MSNSLSHKIKELSPEEQKEVENFVNYLQYKSAEAGAVLSKLEEAEIELRLSEMKQHPETTFPAAAFLEERKLRYGR